MTDMTAAEKINAFHRDYPPLKLPKTRDETLALSESYTEIAEECRENGSPATAQDFDLLALMLRKRGKRMKP
jgi:hypothetical protein